VHASFDGCEAAGLLILLDEAGVQCSAGSACMTGKQQPSHVQKAMGISDERARSSLRISLSIFTTDEEVEAAADAVAKAVAKLRSVQGPPGVGPVMVYGG
jgi:cysteine desulfurase